MFTILAHEDDDAKGGWGASSYWSLSVGAKAVNAIHVHSLTFSTTRYTMHTCTFLGGPDIMLSVLKGTSHLRTGR